MQTPQKYIEGIAQLAVGPGANVQPGQIVAIGCETGHEELARAVADAAYARGAKYVDVSYFDPHVKHSRLKHAKNNDDLEFVPPWLGQRVLDLGELHGARISFSGATDPTLMDDIDPDRQGIDMLPRLKESSAVVGKRLNNWNIVPAPTPGWAQYVHPDLSADDAYAKLWEEVAFICRLNESDPEAAWRERLAELREVAEKLNDLKLDHLHYTGPGTDLTIGLLPGSQWISATLETAFGVTHLPNIPTEEVFTTPDPERVDGHVRATKPLKIPGSATIEGLSVRFEGGRAVEINADRGAETLRTMTQKDPGACRLGEVALVDRAGRIGQTGTVFYEILLDENASSHLALGQAYSFAVSEDQQDRMNNSGIHVDFMVGADDVETVGVTQDGREVSLLKGGDWQI
jgi:aminopeptidase